jgi:hypothetical protein
MSDRVSVMSREPGSKRALPCSSPRKEGGNTRDTLY